MTNKIDIEIFTDGACLGNPGPGGWGVLLRWRGTERELSGGETETTNNRMELMAAIQGLEVLKRPGRVTLNHGQYLRKRRHHQVDLYLEEKRLAFGGEETG